MPARINVNDERRIDCTAEQRFFLLMPVEGRVRFCHYGREDELEPGDFALFDGQAPGRLEFTEPNTSFHLVLSAKDLKARLDRKSTRLNSSHVKISYAVFC